MKIKQIFIFKNHNLGHTYTHTHTTHAPTPKPKPTPTHTHNNLCAGSTKGNRSEPKTCVGQVFHYKLGCFIDVHVLIHAHNGHIYLVQV